jgi:probable rRNA maturation factor
MIKIYIKALTRRLKISPKRLKSITQKVLEFERIPHTKEYDISITLVSNKFIQRLNKEYRKVDSPTDVLAFSMEIQKDKFMVDIYISVDRAEQQISKNETLEIEITRLLIHGLLHILGYEHSEQMFNKQEDYLQKVK